jgi:hypothetical protein
MEEIKGETNSAALACMNCTDKSSLIRFHGLEHASYFVLLPANSLLLLCRKNGPGAYIVTACFGMYHINMVSPIIDHTSFSSPVDRPVLGKGVSTSMS